MTDFVGAMSSGGKRLRDNNDPEVIALAERNKEFVKDQPVPRVSFALLRVLATVLAETCAAADADASEANRCVDSHVELLRNNTAEQYERLIAIQRPAAATPQGTA